jgi:hypothetical protein
MDSASSRHQGVPAQQQQDTAPLHELGSGGGYACSINFWRNRNSNRGGNSTARIP